MTNTAQNAEKQTASTPVSWDGRECTERDWNGCFAHSLAYLLTVPSIEVPNSQLMADEGKGPVDELAQSWLSERGLTLIAIPSPAPLQILLENLEKLNPGVPFILGGGSKTEPAAAHAVVFCAGRIVCDPWDNGIGSPAPGDGNYWIFYLGVRRRTDSQPDAAQ